MRTIRQMIVRERQVWALSAAFWACGFSQGVFLPFLSLYIQERMAITIGTIGVVIGTYAVFNMVFSLIGGSWIDRFGRKKVMVVSLALNALLIVFYTLVSNFYHLLAVSGLLGAFAGLYTLSANTLTIEIVHETYRARALGLVRIGLNAGLVMGSGIGGLLITRLGYMILFYVAGLFSMVSSLIALFFIREDKRRITTSHSGKPANVSDAMRNITKRTSFALLCIGWALTGIVYWQLTSIFPLYATEVVNITFEQLGILFSLNGVLALLFQIPTAAWVDKTDKIFACVIGQFLITVSFLMFAFSTSYIFFVLWFIVLTLGEDIIAPVTMSLVADFSDTEERGRFMGIFQSFGGLASIIGPTLSGYIWDISGNPQMPWYISGTVGFLSLIIYYLIKFTKGDRYKVSKLPNHSSI